MLERVDEAQEYAPTTDSSSAGENGDASVEPEREAASSDSDSGAAEEITVDSNWDDNEDFYDGSTSFSRDDDDTRDPFEHRAAGAESLRDYLLADASDAVQRQ
ncbi:MAG: hypothetical protein R3F37_13140 [Candidatus Competibacteraceae bacterium]